MATIALTALGTYVGGPLGGAIGAAIGSYIDNRWLFPSLLGEGDTLDPKRLLDLPVGSNDAGAPRVWAIGRRIRVPCHIMWQTSKEREVNASQNKDGTAVPQKQVIFNFAVALNSRPTRRLSQFVGNGKLLTWSTLNLVSVRTSEMDVSVVSGRLKLAMRTNLDPDFKDRFEVGDYVLVTGVRETAGAPVHNTYFRIHSLTGHGTTPSSIVLDAVDGQNLSGFVGNAGTIYDPAEVFRVDDTLIGTDVLANTLTWPPNRPATWMGVQKTGPNVSLKDFSVAFEVGVTVRCRNFQAGNGLYNVVVTSPGIILFRAQSPTIRTFPSPNPSLQYVVEPVYGATFTSAVLPRPGLFYSGGEDQLPSPLIEDDRGVGNVPAYRGQSYVVFEKFNSTIFGNSLPAAIENLIDPDDSMTWQEAVVELMERGGISRTLVDASGISRKPFEGYYVSGAVSTASALQPLLIAGGILGQERGKIIAMFEVDRSDVVQVENGPEFSDLGARMAGSEPSDEKLRWGRVDPADLPTSVGLRHQDPDEQYTYGYQHFGLRNPSASDRENRVELNMRTLALTKKEARNLCATHLRRIWVSSAVVQMDLTANYAHVLENDLLTVTDDDGRDVLVRVVKRDIGSNWLLKVTAVREELNLAVSGSPVQSAAGRAPRVGVTASRADGVVLDIPSLSNAMGSVPGLLLLAGADDQSRWAGCSVFESANAGASWERVGGISTLTMTARLSVDMPAGPAYEEHGTPNLTLDTGTVDVDIETEGPLGGPYPVAEADARDGANWVAIIDELSGLVEIAAFTTATQNTATNWTLSGWLRGLRGTIPSSHPTGCRVVLLRPFELFGLWRERPGETAPRALEYRFVPPGKTIEDVESVSLTATWRNASPMPVRNVVKTISGTNTARFTVDHWTRTHQPLGAQGPFPLDETYEAYRVELWDPTGTRHVRSRTISARSTGTPALRDKWVEFSSAELSAAGYTPGPSVAIWVNVVQIGDFGESPKLLRLL